MEPKIEGGSSAVLLSEAEVYGSAVRKLNHYAGR